MAQKCVHKGCGKVFQDETEECVYHPGPPIFHEGQKGWKCCKPRVLTFDEFLTIPPCTTGKHSTVDDTPAPEPQTTKAETETAPTPKPISNAPETAASNSAQPRPSQAQPQEPPPPTASPESDSDDPATSIPPGTTCRRRGCEQAYEAGSKRDNESCVHHPGQALFHEGTKGWTCCKRRVLEFSEFMQIEGCETKDRHLFIGSGKGKDILEGEEGDFSKVRHDFYQTPSSVIVSYYLKKIDPSASTVTFPSPTTIELDLFTTTDRKRYKATFPLYASINTEKSKSKIMGTKLELTLAKADGSGWPVLKSDDARTGEIIQVGKAGRA
ncbi:MAG: hypothetical protein M1835_004537 [Candelina submexicana]|nr:MAG: hypothetical protein M1835_004537 [Candelina submexicana]